MSCGHGTLFGYRFTFLSKTQAKDGEAGLVEELLLRHPSEISDLLRGKAQFHQLGHGLVKSGLRDLNLVDVGSQRHEMISTLLLSTA